VLAGVLIVALVLIWLIWSQWDSLRELLGRPQVVPVESVAAADPGGDEAREDQTEPASAGDEAARRWTELLGRPPVWPEDLSAPRDCQKVEADLAHICVELDGRSYLAGGPVPGGTCGLFQQVAQKLAERPPAVTSELRSYEAILSNVFHLFRALGRERVNLLRRILEEEQELAEPMAMALYRWLVSRERCARSGRTAVRPPVLYDYSAFLFQTMGGQAYLRRRPPEIEALVGFYALVILDRSDQQGHNPYGADPRPEIERTRSLLASRPLVFSERYREVLDEIALRWEQRASD
jgi:hypothetical protein